MGGQLKQVSRQRLLAVAMLLFCSCAQAEPTPENDSAWRAGDDDWRIAGELFLWGADLDASATVADVEIPFKDIFRSLEFAFMGKLAAARGDWALFAELIYLDLESDKTLSESPRIDAGVGMKGLITTAGGGYRLVSTSASTLHALAGLRYLSLDTDLAVSVDGMPLPPIAESGSNWDGVVGLRGEYGFSRNWVLTYYGDVGTGGSDLTWHVLAAINYRLNRWAFALGYSLLDYDFDSKARLKDLQISGPYAGVQYRFR